MKKSMFVLLAMVGFISTGLAQDNSMIYGQMLRNQQFRYNLQNTPEPYTSPSVQRPNSIDGSQRAIPPSFTVGREGLVENFSLFDEPSPIRTTPQRRPVEPEIYVPPASQLRPWMVFPR